MKLMEKIEKDLIQALKAKDALRVSTLRMVKSEVNNALIQWKKAAAADADVERVLQKAAKQRRESAESFEKAGRRDLAEREKKELALIESYLPEPLGAEEIQKLAREAIRASGAKSKDDLGKVMKELMPKVKGKADGRLLNEVVAGLLS